jgi:NAD(P)-dependent dehydrogenase (short-subunit alcohol dehydrogenase family)
MFKLTDKIALVTGAGSGIGAAMAETFAQAEAHVFVTDLNEDAGRAVVRKITSAGGKAEFALLDVSREEECRRVAEEILSSHHSGHALKRAYGASWRSCAAPARSARLFAFGQVLRRWSLLRFSLGIRVISRQIRRRYKQPTRT